MNDATVDIQLAVKSEKIKYDKSNELFIWSVTNAKIVKNSFDEKKVDKEPNAKFKRIDAVDAWVDAHTTMMKYKTKEVVDVKTELEKYLEKMGWKK